MAACRSVFSSLVKSTVTLSRVDALAKKAQTQQRRSPWGRGTIAVVGLLVASLAIAAPAESAKPPEPGDNQPTADPADIPMAPPEGVHKVIDSVYEKAEARGVTPNNLWYEAQGKVVVAFVPPSPEGDLEGFKADIAEMSATADGFTVSSKDVLRSLDESKAAQERLTSDTEYWAARNVTVTGSGINTDGDTVVADVLNAETVEDVRQQMVARYGPVVDVQNVAARAQPSASRQSDYSPWYGGDRITLPSGGECTSGFSVYKPGYGSYMLTAGHCFSGTGQSTSYTFTPPFGSAYFGYVSQWENTYGQPSDYALVTGNYSPYVWSGGPNGTSFLPVTSSNNSSGEPTNEVCFDGGFTGQVCRGMVNRTNVTLDLSNGNRTTGLVEAIHYDPGYMCQLGDSGSPVYDGYLPGGLRARGIFVAQFAIETQAQVCYYLPWNTLASRLGSAQGKLQVDVP